MASKDAEKFFEKCINKINDHLKNLFRLKNGRGISTIILVGGFAESPMLLEGIKSTFPEMRTIVPKDAPWSVLRGAVIFGHDPSLIRQRRSKYTYGICVIEKFDSLLVAVTAVFLTMFYRFDNIKRNNKCSVTFACDSFILYRSSN